MSWLSFVSVISIARRRFLPLLSSQRGRRAMSESAAIPDEFADLVSFAIASQQAATTASAAASSDEAEFARAAELIRSADVLLVGAGAGMGVDSGLPDFRGPEGFWKAYPAFKGKRFGESFVWVCAVRLLSDRVHRANVEPSLV
jgi:hypothetical protein